MKLAVKKATIDVSVYVFIQNSSLTTGAGLTGLVYNSASLVCYYVRPLGNATQLSLATQTVTGVHSDGGFVEVDATNMPGVYRLDLSDAICATGVNSVVVMLKGATNMAPVLLEIQLVSYDPNDAAALGLSLVPTNVVQISGDSAAADNLETAADGGSYNLGGGGVVAASVTGNVGGNVAGSVNSVTNRVTANTDQIEGVDATNQIRDAILTDATRFAGADIAAILLDTAEIGTAGAGLTNINLPDQTMNIIGNITGNLSGSVGSVTNPVTVGTNNDKTGYALTSAYDPAKTAAQAGDPMTLTSGERTAIATAHQDLTDGVETGVTPRQKDRIVLAACAGKGSGAATTTMVYRDTNDSKDRITATVDADGNRTAVTLDAS